MSRIIVRIESSFATPYALYCGPFCGRLAPGAPCCPGCGNGGPACGNCAPGYGSCSIGGYGYPIGGNPNGTTPIGIGPNASCPFIGCPCGGICIHGFGLPLFIPACCDGGTWGMNPPWIPLAGWMDPCGPLNDGRPSYGPPNIRADAELADGGGAQIAFCINQKFKLKND